MSEEPNGEVDPSDLPSGDPGLEHSAPTERLEGPATEVVPPATVGGRNLRVAIITGVGLAALVLILIAIGPLPFFLLALVVLLMAQAEFYVSVRKGGYSPAGALGLVAGGVLLVGTFTRGEAAAGLVLFLTIVFSFVWFLAHEKRGSVLADISVTLLGVAYVPLLGSFVGLILRRGLNEGCTVSSITCDGRGIVIAVIGAAALYDVFAYAAGSKFGKRAMAPRISPRKTIEGALIATVAMLIVGPPIASWLGPWNYGQAMVFVLLACVAATMGDLAESMLKRDLDIKDMGAIFPGHGGALDRLDAILFVLLAGYLTLRLFGL